MYLITNLSICPNPHIVFLSHLQTFDLIRYLLRLGILSLYCIPEVFICTVLDLDLLDLPEILFRNLLPFDDC